MLCAQGSWTALCKPHLISTQMETLWHSELGWPCVVEWCRQLRSGGYLVSHWWNGRISHCRLRTERKAHTGAALSWNIKSNYVVETHRECVARREMFGLFSGQETLQHLPRWEVMGMCGDSLNWRHSALASKLHQNVSLYHGEDASGNGMQSVL